MPVGRWSHGICARSSFPIVSRVARERGPRRHPVNYLPVGVLRSEIRSVGLLSLEIDWNHLDMEEK